MLLSSQNGTDRGSPMLKTEERIGMGADYDGNKGRFHLKATKRGFWNFGKMHKSSVKGH